MLLRRFSKHFSEQNWFAVGLDVIVVIVGIFLGMQVQQWYEERKQQELLTSYYDRLLDDMTRTARKGLQEEEISKFIIDKIITINEIINNSEHSDSDTQEVLRYLPNLSISRKLRFYMGTIEELNSSGNIAFIKDQKLRTSLLFVQENFERDLVTLDRIRDDVLPAIQSFNIRFARPLPINDKITDLDIDISGLKYDEEFNQQLKILYKVAFYVQLHHLEQAYYACDIINQVVEIIDAADSVLAEEHPCSDKRVLEFNS